MSKPLDVTLRIEQPGDYAAVENLTREAFWNLYKPGCDEHYLAHIMREHIDFLPELSFVAEHQGQIVGSIMYTQSRITDDTHNSVTTATFGPLCVHPEYQFRGVGAALINKTKEIARDKGYPAIVILGDPHNYCRHGFKNGRDHCVSNQSDQYPLGLLVLELKPNFFDGRKWRFKESAVFDFNPEEAEKYDQTLPTKEKFTQASQEVYSILIRSLVTEDQQKQ